MNFFAGIFFKKRIQEEDAEITNELMNFANEKQKEVIEVRKETFFKKNELLILLLLLLLGSDEDE